MSKRTPGPWSSGYGIDPETEQGEYYILAKSPTGFGHNRLATVDGELPSAKANAVLMAAAPEMLSALYTQVQASPFKSDQDSCECGDFEESGTCPEVIARRAIARAEGRLP